VREEACIGGATMPQPWTLRLTRNAAALAASSPDFALQASLFYCRTCLHMWCFQFVVLGIKSDPYKLFINLTLLGHVTENFDF
jgi:hypothetical protein